MQLTTLLAGSLIFVSCASSAYDMPNSNGCGVNAQDGYQRCYNFKRDFDEDFDLKPGAKPFFKDAKTAADLHKNICFDPDSWGNLRGFIKFLLDELERSGRRGD